MKNKNPVIYLGLSRLHRNRANLIQTLHTVAGLRKVGVDVQLYLPPWGQRTQLARRLDDMGIPADLDVRPAQFLHSRWKSFLPFAFLNRRKLLQATGVHVRSPDLSLALSRFAIPHSLEIHEIARLQKEEKVSAVLEAHRQGIIRHLFPINQGTAQFFLDQGTDPARVHVCPSGFDESAFASISEFTAEGLTQPTIVHLGLISKNRGLDIFLAAAGHGCQVTLIGECRAEIPPDAKVQRLAPIPLRDVPGWYDRTQLILLPYQADIDTARSMSPIKVFEAMAAGRPIIASDLPAIRELLKDEWNALLVPANDEQAWLDAIERLQKNPHFAKRLAAQAKHDSQEFSWRKRAETIARVSGWL